MDIYFPTSIQSAIFEKNSFSKWINIENIYEVVKVELALPSFLQLYRMDTICPTPDMPFVDLGYFKDKDSRVEVIIQASAIQNEISLQNYYTFFANNSKEVVLKERIIEQNDDRPDILLAKEFADGQKWITRRTGFKTWMGEGSFVITLNLACNQEIYNEMADVFYYMMSSFKPVIKPVYDLSERLRLISKRYPLDFATYLPFSWQEVHQHSDTESKMNMIFRKKNQGNITTGVLTAFAESYTLENINPYSIIGKFLNRYKVTVDTQKMTLKKISLVGFLSAFTADFDFTVAEGDTKKEYNITFYLALKSNIWIYIEVFGASNKQDFETWAINKRTIDLFLKYFKS